MLKSIIDSLTCKRRSSSKSIFQPHKRAKREHECPICKGVFSTSWVTECGHRFCSKCIEIQLNYTQNCPICRKDLTGTLLGPSKSSRMFEDRFVRVHNGIKCPYAGLEVVVQDKAGAWHDGVVKLVIENGDNFPLLLVYYGMDLIENIPQNSLRLKARKINCKEVKDIEIN